MNIRAFLDYGLNYSKKMYDHINLGYASILSSWALLNSGNEKNDFGYWFKGVENDGAAGWAYEPKLKNKMSRRDFISLKIFEFKNA